MTLTCPHCNSSDALVKHGTNRGGTERCRCLDCKKTFTPNPNPRRVDPQKVKLIEAALEERVPINVILRIFGVSWTTVNNIAKKNLPTSLN
ncbi:IS1/IS1595 family N-terminal zinc-binding domain-containing protein [Armatimonas rosea]|uniref:IS1/IS1595 family N-terminal zinc-binding domain-containing protein n=1 Tax=Armatimonas rosea TaxID=685828 RepID=UPI003CCD38E8